MSRIRTNLITNRMANGAPTVSHGLVVAGVTTITGSINNLNLTGITTISTLDLNGDLDVDGHLNADNVSIAGVVTATSFVGSGANLTGITQTTINNNTNDCIVTATGTTNVLQGESELRWQNGNNLFVRAGEGESATLNLIADQGDDNGDGWKIQSEQDENDLTFKSNISGSYVDKLKLKSNGQLEVQGNLVSTGEISPSGHINLASSKKLSMASDVFKIYHSTNAAIINESGDLLINQNVSNKDIKISTGSGPTERVTITSGGNVGINDSSPTSQLVVKATSDDNPAIRMYRQSTGGDVAALIWQTAAGSQSMINYRGGGGNEGMQFYTNGTASSNERFRIGTDGKLYKGGNQFYPLVNYTEVTTFGNAAVSSSSYTDLRTVYSGYTPKKAGNRIVIHHQSQMWNGASGQGNGDVYWRIMKDEGSGYSAFVTNERILGNHDGWNNSGGYSGLARHHRTVHLMGSFVCNGNNFNLKTQGRSMGVNWDWYHDSNNILQIWEYELN